MRNTIVIFVSALAWTALSLSPASAYGGPREKPSPTLQHAAQRMVFERKNPTV